MRYLVDGYNLLFALEPILSPFTTKREQFVDFLSSLSKKAHLSMTLVFDTHHSKDPSFLPSVTTHKGLEVVYAPSDMSCDDYILEKLASIKVKATWTVVSSDNKLRAGVKRLGAHVIDIDSFVTLINKKIHKHTPSSKSMPSCSRAEYERWLSIFEKKK